MRTSKLNHQVVFVWLMVFSLVFSIIPFARTDALNGFIDPNADGSTGNWNSTGANYSTEIDEATRQPTAPNTTDNISASANNGGSIYQRMNTITGGVTNVSKVQVWIYHNDGNNGQISVQLYDDNETTTRSAQQTLPQSATNTWSSLTFNVNLTQAQLGTLSVRLTAGKNGGGSPATIRVHALYADVTYSNVVSTFEQSAYRFFNENNGTDVGAPLAAQDTATVLNAGGDPFRLRMLVHVADANLGINGENFKLQYVDRGTGSCSAPSGGTPATYSDVTGSSVIAYDNVAGGVSEGDALTANANDPTHGGDATDNQTVEEANNFTNSQTSIPQGEDGMWDFALIDNNAPAATTYCFRIVKADNSLLDTYTEYPSITTGNGVLSIDIVDSLGTSVTSPSTTLETLSYLFLCDSSSGILGVDSQRVRVSNFTASPSWSLSIAATAGNTDLWNDGGTENYDFNDPSGTPAGCSDGVDTDSFAGQLSIDPSVATIQPRAGCTSTGINLGASSSFVEGTNDSISIADAGSSTELSCYWDFTNIDLNQQIPSDQAGGSYTINLTMTVTAI